MNENKVQAPPAIEDEMDRIIELSKFELDFSDLQKYLHDLTDLAKKITGMEVSLINLIDSYTQWSVSSTGIDLDQMPRKDSICQYTITRDSDFEVGNLNTDQRFQNKSYVKQDPHFKYYYGIPLVTQMGNSIGALCVLDSETTPLDPEKKELLKLIAKEVVSRLEFIRENNKLRRLIDDKDKRVRQVSHDIRGPVSGIIGTAELIESELDPGKAKNILEMLSLIKKGGKSIVELAEEILRGEALENEQLKEEIAGYACAILVEKLNRLYAPQALEKNIQLTFKTASEGNITTSVNRLIQIAGNLISNSIKFTPKGGNIDVLVKTIQEEGDSKLIIVVKDNGQGIEEHKIEEILSGATDSTTGTKGEKGYGFGLPLVKHLLDEEGGSMEIESEKALGCIISLEIPN